MKLINKALCLVLILFVSSCSVDDSGDKQTFEMLPIESIVFPDEFVLGGVYDIDFTFIRPTSCHGYHDIFISADGVNRTVGVTSIVFGNSNCIELTDNNVAQQSFRIKALYDQTYIFHIWKGTDGNGDDVFEDYEVPVVN